MLFKNLCMTATHGKKIILQTIILAFLLTGEPIRPIGPTKEA